MSPRNTFHQLGMIGYDKAQYTEALNWYQKALEISESIGNRAAIATVLSSIGNILEERKSFEDAVYCHLRALSIRVDIQSPSITQNTDKLKTLSKIIGEDDFLQVIKNNLNDTASNSLLEFLNISSS